MKRLIKVRRTWTRKPVTRVKESKKVYKRAVEKKHFGESAFVDSVWKTMTAQEKKHPGIALLHERLDESVPLIGLTGGIAAGKTTVASMLQESGLPVIDADVIAHEILRPGRPAFKAVLVSFGEGVKAPDGTIDRKRLGEIVFADESKRRLLESITHPEIFNEIVRQIRSLKKNRPQAAKAVIIDAPLLFESGLHEKMHKNILVKLHPDEQLRRLIKREKLSEPEAWQRILSQMPAAEKEKHSDWVIDNSGPLSETRRQVEAILKQAGFLPRSGS